MYIKYCQIDAAFYNQKDYDRRLLGWLRAFYYIK